MSRSLLHQLAFGLWAMRPEAVEAYMPQVQRIISGQEPLQTVSRKDQVLMEEEGVYFVAADGRRLELNAAEPITAEPGLVAVINISGPIMKTAMCGAGMVDIARWLADFEATDEVEGVVIDGDSPGGNGYGMLTLTTQLERMRKPVVTLVQQGMACSAMYGIAAASDLIMSATEVDEFGSIGTYVKLANWDKMYRENKNFPLDIHTIYATRSSEKNGDFRQAMEADPTNADDPHYKALRENYIDPFNEHFIDLVQRNRTKVKDEKGVLQGKVFMAKDAMKYGLIDSTGETMESAIAAVRDLASKRKPQS